jgi:CRP/FNR family cyclic AMP-dependent transcriptional regulator
MMPGINQCKNGIVQMNLLEVFEGTEDLIEYPAESIIFEEGAQGDFMYVIMRGSIQLSLHGELIGEEVAGGIVGEMALLNSDNRSTTAKTSTACLLAPIDLHSFKLLIQHTPDFALHVMNVLADRLRLANEKNTQ